jgi:hypothetical protein
MYGPFHTEHPGIYTVVNADNTPTLTNIVTTLFTRPPNVAFKPSETLYCIEIFGFKVLANFKATPNMVNGINTPVPPLDDCNNYRLTVSTNSTVYKLFGIKEGITVPFYSNCNLADLSQICQVPLGYMSNHPLTSTSQTAATGRA